MKKENFLEQLEERFNQTSFPEIIELVDYIDSFKLGDATVDNIINYVRINNRISFKQWQVLEISARKIISSKTNFKYGD
jgi:hypothetical protein